MQVTLAKALVVKKQLQQKIVELQKRFLANFSHIEGEESNYEPGKVYDELTDTIKKLVIVKAKINEGNLSIQEKILTLGELKSLAKLCQTIPINKKVQRFVRNQVTGANEYVETNVINWLTQPTMDEQLEKFRQMIISTQDEINEHNYKTKIEIPD